MAKRRIINIFLDLGLKFTTYQAVKRYERVDAVGMLI